MASRAVNCFGSPMLERTFHRRPCRATDVSEGLRLTSRAAAPRHLSGCSRQEHKTNTTVFATKIIGSTSEERQSEERFLDVQQILSKFNPLTENHLLVWEDSDDEDGAVQAELPITNSWEDSSEYRGLEHQPSWIDYRDGSESDDSDVLRGAEGAYKALASVLPDLADAEESRETGPPSPAGLATAPAVSAYSPEAGFQEITVTELEERLATGQFSLLIDVRSQQEFDGGHVDGATHLSMDPDLSAAVRAGSLDEFRDRPVAVICGSGMRSGQATVRLTKVYGFTNVTNVTGGMMAWTREGLPVKVNQQRSGCGCGSSGGGGGGGCGSKQAV